jgi:hypothetical protein
MLPADCATCGDARLSQRSTHHAKQRVGRSVKLRIDVIGGQPQRGQARRACDRVPRQRAGLIHGPVGSQLCHDVAASAEGRRWEAAAHDLAERHQIRRPALDRSVETPPAGSVHPEAGHHLVADQQRAVRGARLGEEAVEAWLRSDRPHVAGGSLRDEAGDAVSVLGEGSLDGVDVVVGQHDGRRGDGCGDAWRSRHGERGEPGAAEASRLST